MYLMQLNNVMFPIANYHKVYALMNKIKKLFICITIVNIQLIDKKLNFKIIIVKQTLYGTNVCYY